MAPAPGLTAEAIAALLNENMAVQVDEVTAARLATYLELFKRWNSKVNLSAVRDDASIVLRHFGESLQCAAALPSGTQTLLDYGSGGGFPGAVCAMAKPGIAVTLAESQNKKAAFLQELCRVLALNAKVHASRVETLPAAMTYDVVTLRAVDQMADACLAARKRVRRGGHLVVVTSEEAFLSLAGVLDGVSWARSVSMRGTAQGIIAVGVA